MSEKITCQICGEQTHSIQIHLKNSHPHVSLDEYKLEYPEAPLLSDFAQQTLAKKNGETASRVEGVKVETVAAVTEVASGAKKATTKKALHEVFGLGEVKAAKNTRGEPIMITCIEDRGDYNDLVPDVDDNYIFNIDLIKTVLMGLELKVPVYLWGHAGTGKTTVLEQTCARTGRPFLRVQHTVNTEEAHIVGQWTVKDGRTVFELGPLAVAMKHGLIYCADEYDFALPSVLSVYQPVLEGKALVIKEADAENRIIKPHPNFRILATGNTNGAGDETGLYQGTNIQNAANYERFGIVEEVRYMPKKQEVGIIVGQAGIAKEDAEKLVDFAAEVRKSYEGGKICATISPRALINAAKIGLRRSDWKVGLSLSFSNRLTRTDREVVDQFAQRLFG